MKPAAQVAEFLATTGLDIDRVHAEPEAAAAAAGEDRARDGILEQRDGDRTSGFVKHTKEKEYEWLVGIARLALYLVRTTMGVVASFLAGCSCSPQCCVIAGKWRDVLAGDYRSP